MKVRQFDDIRLQATFLEDYSMLPQVIKTRVDRRVVDWSITGELPPSAQAHKGRWDGMDVLICYVNCGHGSYRMFVTIENRELICWRVLNHDKQDAALGFSFGKIT